ncbi:hypothetical protein [Yunchengibacter salinarum]|uniref:hypothetical protein n=1 Tax=Yunchengibacter salinarum TaxID=3133399 RepID=UPI0035B5CAF2
MSTEPFTLFDGAIDGLMRGALGDLANRPITACLMAGTYQPGLATDLVWSDIADHALTDADYAPRALGGQAIISGPDGAALHSDPVDFGDPVTIGPASHLVFVLGQAGALAAGDRLLGVQTLDPAGGGLKAINGAFSVQPANGGWFALGRDGVSA